MILKRVKDELAITAFNFFTHKEASVMEKLRDLNYESLQHVAVVTFGSLR